MSSKSFLYGFCFLISKLILSEVHGQCEPGFADTCFTAVQHDLDTILDASNNNFLNTSDAALEDLCLSLDDSLLCTTDIIDTDCSLAEGRESFDSWTRALRSAYDSVCVGSNDRLRDLLSNIQCWNVNTFIACTTEKANLSHIRDLLHTSIDKVECSNLNETFRKCTQDASTGSCREQDSTLRAVDKVFDAFMDGSHCNDYGEKIRITVNVFFVAIGIVLFFMSPA
ncbi:uncharacterized protein LOC106462232 [Limulus polyphemus]|uniref:Uncharacterized protein LOC106462232 n=1 Tax=Limulus polyphemus TaxID=6850 RepID=A0ABM1B9J7_LIMPO|nr:uncharacterized protein LOC106462232 [Limulus polyphemus]